MINGEKKSKKQKAGTDSYRFLRLLIISPSLQS